MTAPIARGRETPAAAIAMRCGLAPDRLLFVRRKAVQAHPEALGWSTDNVAVTDVSDGFLLFDVSGPSALDVMALGADYDFASTAARPNESAAMLFAGLKVSIARIAGGWRLHIERSYAAALWQWLEQATRNQTRAAGPAGASSSQ